MPNTRPPKDSGTKDSKAAAAPASHPLAEFEAVRKAFENLDRDIDYGVILWRTELILNEVIKYSGAWDNLFSALRVYYESEEDGDRIPNLYGDRIPNLWKDYERVCQDFTQFASEPAVPGSSEPVLEGLVEDLVKQIGKERSFFDDLCKRGKGGLASGKVKWKEHRQDRSVCFWLSDYMKEYRTYTQGLRLQFENRRLQREAEASTRTTQREAKLESQSVFQKLFSKGKDKHTKG